MEECPHERRAIVLICLACGDVQSRARAISEGKESFSPQTPLFQETCVSSRNGVIQENPDKEGANRVPAAETLEQQRRRERHEQAKVILQVLNEVSGRAYRAVKSNLQYIEARLRDGVTVDQCLAVIRQQADQWRGKPEMWAYLRPSTLFNATKCEAYLGKVLARRKA